MITIVIPTRNRAYSLAMVAGSYFRQEDVNEIIFVDDAGSDDTENVVRNIAAAYPQIALKYLRHTVRQGASAARITGYENATNEYVMFGEDDAYLGNGYARGLHAKLTADANAPDLASGRIIYLEKGESLSNALRRFGVGLKKHPYLNKTIFGHNPDAIFSGDMEVPFTHALFMTSKALLQRYKYDPYYGKGNGFREETDFQINAFVHGCRNVLTNDVHCFHMHRDDVKAGGQRTNRFRQLYWCVHYTNYFFDKYYDHFRETLSMPHSRSVAKIRYASYQTYFIFVRPVFRPLFNKLLRIVAPSVKRLLRTMRPRSAF
jgi:glycosyltransferase involved in cell wall biosynthesis